MAHWILSPARLPVSPLSRGLDCRRASDSSIPRTPPGRKNPPDLMAYGHGRPTCNMLGAMNTLLALLLTVVVASVGRVLVLGILGEFRRVLGEFRPLLGEQLQVLLAGQQGGDLPGRRARLHRGLREVGRPVRRLPEADRRAGQAVRHHELGRQPGHLRGHRAPDSAAPRSTRSRSTRTSRTSARATPRKMEAIQQAYNAQS